MPIIEDEEERPEPVRQSTSTPNPQPQTQPPNFQPTNTNLPTPLLSILVSDPTCSTHNKLGILCGLIYFPLFLVQNEWMNTMYTLALQSFWLRCVLELWNVAKVDLLFYCEVTPKHHLPVHWNFQSAMYLFNTVSVSPYFNYLIYTTIFQQDPSSGWLVGLNCFLPSFSCVDSPYSLFRL